VSRAVVRLTRTARFTNQDSLRWPLVGMLLVLVLFGHDALMTAEARAGQLVLPGTPTIDTLDHNTHQGPDKGPTSSASNSHLSHPDTDCSVNTNVATIQGSGFSPQLFPPAIAVSAPSVPTRSGADATSEPVTPPGVRRALLQVYLI
jgi:hypothetical protein